MKKELKLKLFTKDVVFWGWTFPFAIIMTSILVVQKLSWDWLFIYKGFDPWVLRHFILYPLGIGAALGTLGGKWRLLGVVCFSLGILLVIWM